MNLDLTLNNDNNLNNTNEISNNLTNNEIQQSQNDFLRRCL